ncbi:MAG: hypothetical protein ACOVLB_04750, partial [Candidatus Nanopelagicus sp.]
MINKSVARESLTSPATLTAVNLQGAISMIIYYPPIQPRDFYVYAYLRQNGTPYYIGKGMALRAWDNNHAVNLPDNISNIIIVSESLTEIGALALERRMIRWYGRKDLDTGILRNRTDGGDGGLHVGHDRLKPILLREPIGQQIH